MEENTEDEDSSMDSIAHGVRSKPFLDLTIEELMQVPHKGICA